MTHRYRTFTFKHKYTGAFVTLTVDDVELEDIPVAYGRVFERGLEKAMRRLGCTDKDFLDVIALINKKP